MELTVDVRRLWLVLGGVIVALVAAHFLGMFFIFISGHDYVLGFVPLFSLDGEGNVPAWFSTGILLFCAQLLLTTALAERRRRAPWAGWMGLAGIFAFLSVDEMAVLHERMGRAAGDLVGAEGLMHVYAWVAVYAPLLTLFVIGYIRFLARLPHRIRFGMVLAGAVYVGGAIGIELAGSPFWAMNVADRQWPYFALVGLEEAAEMLGIWIFIRVILLYQAQSGLTIAIERVGGAPGIFSMSGNRESEG